MAWTLTEIERACNEARAIARGQDKPAQVIRKGAGLRAVARALPHDEVIVKDVDPDYLSAGQITAVREIMGEIMPIREAFLGVREIMARRADGKPWSELDKRQILDAVARSWNTLDARA